MSTVVREYGSPIARNIANFDNVQSLTVIGSEQIQPNQMAYFRTDPASGPVDLSDWARLLRTNFAEIGQQFNREHPDFNMLWMRAHFTAGATTPTTIVVNDLVYEFACVARTSNPQMHALTFTVEIGYIKPAPFVLGTMAIIAIAIAAIAVAVVVAVVAYLWYRSIVVTQGQKVSLIEQLTEQGYSPEEIQKILNSLNSDDFMGSFFGSIGRYLPYIVLGGVVLVGLMVVIGGGFGSTARAAVSGVERTGSRVKKAAKR